MKVALAHHWVMSYRGGEKVAEQMAAIFPDAELHTLTRDPNIVVPGLKDTPIHTSVLNRLPGIAKTYKHLLPLHPWAISQMEVPEDTDVLLSSDASLIKGITCGPNTQQVCYCHSPPRYLWELGDEYKRTSLAARLLLDRMGPRLRNFDHQAAQQVAFFIANSNFVADRIRRYYGRDSHVIYPPVATHDFKWDRTRDDFHFVLSELAPYKRIDIAVRAYNELETRLVVVGDGSERKHLESIAGPNIEFRGRQSFSVLRELMETCAAFVFPGVEDFGITPVEAQAAGAPVIAFRAGGALETVIEHKTGLFFNEQTPESLLEVIAGFRSADFSPLNSRANAERFSVGHFRENLRGYLERIVGIKTPGTNERETFRIGA
ncbi:GDP-mannose-dependent alpha-mannosyltransferase [Rubripirellula obstinata]|uniref:GDP-mannose-dependent alpha-mannosyltransferase n=1 Tax=Rubripirellula obstinata TaxID=406547 RepID=A0A5B1CPT6_9BACT|nr:glycosyltransferase [Rubripirellula obstinata]KAA1262402.1 GDP-mannose-dependent alpha-mannosyltransferase [Rubripirellula obstinata]